MTPARRDEILRLCEEALTLDRDATPGPWRVRRNATEPCHCCDVITASKVKHVRPEQEVCLQVFGMADSDLIAEYRSITPQLAAAVRELLKEQDTEKETKRG